ANSRDTWVYRYYVGDQEYHRQLIFEEGKVVSIGPSQMYPDETERLQKADSMAEFEKAAKQKQSGYEKGFKDVESSDDD
ncbi:MAG: hypothetical protein AAF202_08420, partial [Pseudomonadota bacterium]